MKKATVVTGVLVERVGHDLMVIVPGDSDVVSLSGRPAEVLLDVQAGRDVDPSEPALETLSGLGIVNSPGLSRRGLITAGAIGAGTGIAVMAMPSVAAASSIDVADDVILPTRFDLKDFLLGDDTTRTLVVLFVDPEEEPNFPAGLPRLSPATYTTNSGLVVEMQFESNPAPLPLFGGFFDEAPGSIDLSQFAKGELEFTFEGIDYVGVADFAYVPPGSP